MKLQEVKNIHIKTRYLLSGYFRNVQFELFKDYISNVYHTIPQLAQNLCLLYYYQIPMIFDSFGLNTKRMEIINDYEVKCLQSKCDGHWGSAIRLKYKMPIHSKGNNYNKIKSISWALNHSAFDRFPNGIYFIGVVSNQITDFTRGPFAGLKKAFGISGHHNYVYKGSGYHEEDNNYKGYWRNGMVKIEYNVIKSTLMFYKNVNELIYTAELPTDDEYTMNWYPCIALRDNGDVCKISKDVIVKYM